jgi:hypothetical protein
LKLVWKDYQARLLDPDTADDLVREAYTFSGATLSYFAEELRVPKELLAQIIVTSFPEQADRSELQHIMTYIVPRLESIYRGTADS